MLKDNLPVYNLTLDDNDVNLGCTKISLVEQPAVDEMFLAFDSHPKLKTLFEDEIKHIVTGVAMRANYPIYRNQDGEEFYVMFTADTIEKMANKFMREQRTFDISLNHEKDVTDCYLVESFLINKERGICPKEFQDVEDGSWVISVKIDNPDVWNEVVNTDVKGFSIETQMIANAFHKDKKKSAQELGITETQLDKLLSVFK